VKLMTAASEHVSKTTALAIRIGLLPVLGAILFGLFVSILPVYQLKMWSVPALIAASGIVAILIAWPARQPVRTALLDGLAATLSMASAIPGIAVAMLITYGLALQIAENRSSTHSLVFRLTGSVILRQILIFALVPVLPGVVGLLLARRRATARTSPVAMAARFATLSLTLSGLILSAVTVAALYHRVEWP
jgi:hypothetical protein